MLLTTGKKYVFFGRFLKNDHILRLWQLPTNLRHPWKCAADTGYLLAFIALIFLDHFYHTDFNVMIKKTTNCVPLFSLHD